MPDIVKLAIGFGVGFSVVVVILFSLISGVDRGLEIGLIAGAVAVVATPLIAHKLAPRFGVSLSGTSGPRQRRSIVLAMPRGVALEKARAAAEAIGTQVTEVDAKGLVAGKVPGDGRRSYGERITMSLVDLPDGHTEVTVASAPVLWTTLVDYGKGRENVEAIVRHLGAA
ncbi:MAG: hypothetical protein H6843_17170 [Rhodospirillaceae bacterium]|nr:hypothetical protein [Rhodospirillaceae bacterium]